jgi:hypothetical protein
LNPQLLEVKDEVSRGENGTFGQVSGIASYHDRKGGPAIDVRFTFSFTRSSKEDHWLLINAFAAPIG